MAKYMFWALAAMAVLVLFEPQFKALAESNNVPSVTRDAAGNLHITAAEGQDIILNGIDVLGELAALNATLTEVLAMFKAASIPLPPARFLQQFELMHSSKDTDDNFGWSAAVDGERSVVGIPFDDTKGSNAGAVAAYRFDGTTWIFEQLITAADGTTDDHYGFSVRMSGTTIIVGARFGDATVADTGAAYIHVRSGTNSDATPWTQQQKLTASDGAKDNVFGFAVDVSNNVCIVGAFKKDDDGTDSGAIYLYLRTGTTWTEQQKMVASDATVGDVFGYAVGISDNVAVVGAFGNDDAGTSSGAAYLLESTNDGTSWTQTAKVVASDDADSDYFGFSVDVDDGTVAVGAYREDAKGASSGSAYVFTKSTSTNSWTETDKLIASDGSDNHHFGWAVSVSGDRIIVGAPLSEVNGLTNQGSAYIFALNGTTSKWEETDHLLADNAASEDQFGFTVGISGTTAIVGAHQTEPSSSSFTNSGSAYIFTSTSDY